MNRGDTAVADMIAIRSSLRRNQFLGLSFLRSAAEAFQRGNETACYIDLFEAMVCADEVEELNAQATRLRHDLEAQLWMWPNSLVLMLGVDP